MNKIVYEGSISNYFQIDLSNLFVQSKELLKELEEKLTIMKFSTLGDLYSSTFGDLYIRGYAQNNGVTYSTITCGVVEGVFDILELEFNTTFESGSSLTTTTTAMPVSLEKKRIFVRSYSMITNPVELFKNHTKHILDLQKTQGMPCKVTPDLFSLAKSIDEYFKRRFSDN